MIPITLRRRTDKERADYLSGKVVELLGELYHLRADLGRAHCWAVAGKRAAKVYFEAYHVECEGSDYLLDLLDDWEALYKSERKRARKWKRRAKAAMAKAETTVTGKVTGSILGMPVIEAKDWSEFTRVKATLVTDGNIYMFAICPYCGGTRQVVRPGDIRCGECGR